MVASLVMLVAVTRSAAGQTPSPGPLPPPPPPVYGPYPPPPAQPAQPPPPQVWQVPAPAQPPRVVITPAVPIEPPAVIYDWDPDVPPPTGYLLRERPNGKLIGVGVAMLTSGWATSALAAAVGGAAERDDDDPLDDAIVPDDWVPLYVPVGGPFVAMRTLDPGPSGVGLLLLSGVWQSAGVLGIVLGIADTRYKIVRDPSVQAPRDPSFDGARGSQSGSARTPLVIAGSVLTGLGAATLLAAGITWTVAAGESLELDDECPDNVCYTGTPGGDAYEHAKDAEYAADVLVGIGAPVTGAGVALLLYAAGLGSSGSKMQIRTTPLLGQQGGGLRVQGVF